MLTEVAEQKRGFSFGVSAGLFRVLAVKNVLKERRRMVAFETLLIIVETQLLNQLVLNTGLILHLFSYLLLFPMFLRALLQIIQLH